jgi:hypothetical protein
MGTAKVGPAAVLLACVWTASGARADQDPVVKARTHLVVGEVARLDLQRRRLVVKTTEKEPREIDITVEPATRITAMGRARSLEDLRPGSLVAVTCADGAEGAHVARLVRVRAAPAPPAPSPKPRL